MDPSNIEIHSDEVQEIIGTPPRKILRIGMTVVFLIILLLVTGSIFFKYPDIIRARVTLKGENPSADILARAEGKITHLFVQDKESVTRNKIIAIVENTCNFKDLIRLKKELDSIESSVIDFEDFVTSYDPNDALQLGELQVHYSKFYREIRTYKDFLQLNYHTKKIRSLRKQKAAYGKYLKSLKDQYQLSEADLELNERQYQRDSVLFKKEFMSETDFEKSKSQVILKKNNLADSRNSISNTEIKLTELEQLIIETEIEMIDQKRQYVLAITESLDNLKAGIKSWEQTYLLKSPIEGTVTFTNYHNENQNVSIGEIIFSVVPNKSAELIAYAEVPLSGSGKVKKGQKVNIKFDDFPDTQFGMVKGKVRSMSLVQTNDFYTVKIELPDSLTTNYKKTLPFKQNMKGNAEILTDDLPLIARIINPIKSLFYERF
jgi:HlyD family secretion protein